MDKNLLKSLLIEQNELLKSRDIGIPREKLSEISAHKELPHAVVISGLRRCGKSTLLHQLMNTYPGQPLYYFNFEDERLLGFGPDDFDAMLELCHELFGPGQTLFLDEIQNASGWDRFVRRMADSNHKVYLTGSNALLLSKEISTRLTGRNIPVVLFPFSFREYLSFKGMKVDDTTLAVTSRRGLLKRHFSTYLREGGLPEYLTYGNRELLQFLYDDILYRDIVARYDIKDVGALKELTRFLLSNVGTLVSYNRLKTMLGLGSVNTVKSYVEYLENTYLIFTVPLYAHSTKKQIVNPRKVYAIDNGMVNLVSFRFSNNQGRFLENLVFLHLKRQNWNVFYYRTKQGLEVDLVTCRGNRIQEIFQVCWNMGDLAMRDREIRSLVAAMEELKVSEGTILTSDESENITIQGMKIRVLPVYRWLLE